MANLRHVRELAGRLERRTLAWVGDGNNVARSVAMGCGKVGMRLVMATPDGYRFDNAYLATLQQEVPGLDLVFTEDAAEAVSKAVAVYTDVWTSMGQEAEMERRRVRFPPLPGKRPVDVPRPEGRLFMHCLPARRGEEVTTR